ncbi:MAG: hypothetical protein REJ23_09570 [Brevundimonas sp.]|nr:hypothetical protein [Brevundimonas sp.]
MIHRAHIADRKAAAKAIAVVRAPSIELVLNTLILSVILALLTGAVWTHVT